MDLLKIGKFIQRKRKEKSLTQAELAEALGLTDRAVSKWENGVCLPDADNIFELCKLLDMSISDFFNGEETMEKTTDNNREIMIDLLKQKQQSEKRLLNIEIVLGIMSLVVMFFCIIIAALLEMPVWTRILIIAFGFAVFIVAMAFALRIEQKAGYYECAKCHHKYVPTYGKVLMAPHVNRTRYMKCPCCNERSWQKKVLSSEEDVENIKTI